MRLIALDENSGFARGNNLAIEAASKASEWVALINPDAFADPRWLEELLAGAKCNREFDAFGSKLFNAADSNLLDGIGDAYHISGRLWRTAHKFPVSALSECACEIFSPCAAAALYRRSALLEVGGFDEDFFLLRRRCRSRLSLALGWLPEPLCSGISGASCRLGYDRRAA